MMMFSARGGFILSRKSSIGCFHAVRFALLRTNRILKVRRAGNKAVTLHIFREKKYAKREKPLAEAHLDCTHKSVLG